MRCWALPINRQGTRSCLAAVPLQLRRTRERSGIAPDRRHRLARKVGSDNRQGEEGASLPALGQNHRAASSPRRATSQRGAFVSEPSWRALHALRHSHTGRAVRHEAACHRAGSPGKADQSPRHSPFDRHALAAGGRRHQHNSGLARACVARHHQHLRRDRSCDKETSAGDAGSRENTKDGWRMVSAAGCNGFPSRPVASRICGAGLVVAIKDWPRSGSAPHIGERHILVVMWPAT